MPGTDHQGPQRRPHLTDDERKEIATLAAICNAHEGLALKLSIGMRRPDADQAAGDLLFYADHRLAGYCALDSSNGPLFDLCGMVHPDYRRCGTGSGRAWPQAYDEEWMYNRGCQHRIVFLHSHLYWGHP